MDNPAAVTQRLREEQQRGDAAQRAVEHVEWRKNFVLIFVLIVLTLVVATVLANRRFDGT